MTFDEAIAEVVSITKRPDKAAEIISNLNKAMAFWTLKADFGRDLVESYISTDPNLYSQEIDLSDVNLTPPIVRFRKIKYIKPRGVRYYLTQIDPVQILTPKGNVQPNRFYLAGQNLVFVLSQLNTFLDIGYYQHAPILAAGDTTGHWMLDLMPWAITERAASQIFKSIGDDNSAGFYAASSLEFFLVARRDFEDQVSSVAT